VIPAVTENGMNVTMIDTVLGNMWLKMIREFEAPSARAAATYSRAFSL
jgi:hypothetical protein